jgi:hypothetical protein
MRAQVDAVCLRYACERCGAAPGTWCLTRYGQAAVFLHVSRFSQAVTAGDLPLRDDAAAAHER